MYISMSKSSHSDSVPELQASTPVQSASVGALPYRHCCASVSSRNMLVSCRTVALRMNCCSIGASALASDVSLESSLHHGKARSHQQCHLLAQHLSLLPLQLLCIEAQCNKIQLARDPLASCTPVKDTRSQGLLVIGMVAGWLAE